MTESNDKLSMLEKYGRKMGDIKYDAIDREDIIEILDANVRRPFLKKYMFDC